MRYASYLIFLVGLNFFSSWAEAAFRSDGCDFSAHNAKVQSSNKAIRRCGGRGVTRQSEWQVSFIPGSCWQDPTDPLPCFPVIDTYCAVATFSCRSL